MASEKKYEILETIYDGDHSTIYRTRHDKSGKEVILKQSKNPANAGLYNEYNLLLDQEEDSSEIEITELAKVPVLMRPFYNGKSLRQEIDSKNYGLVFFFNVCFKIIEELQKIHSKKIIHKDLSPENILVNLSEDKVHIIDFEFGTRQQFQNTNYKGLSVIEGNLAYISPEQTGRMNRGVDYRSDYYSLGVIFYEVLCGKKPFEHLSAQELIHCHIAMVPPSLTAVDGQIPAMLAAVINKLMAKNAEERYQSLTGLLIDLEHCKKEWIRTGTVADFELRKGDLPVRLNVTQKLVGRKAETEKIFSLFEEAASGKKILLGLRGLSGLGKTMLVRETARLLTAGKGAYITGKFDSLQRNVPYYGWSQALDQLAELLLTESEEDIALCRRLLNETMQGLEADILAIAPRWKAILVDVPVLPQLNPKEQQSRVRFAVSLFFQSILKITKPLLLFIDDWQWADDASIELLRSISGDGSLRTLFMVMSYRHNEANSTHPFVRVLNDIETNQQEVLADHNLIVDFLELIPLTADDTNEILSETFSIAKTDTKELGDLIYAKTQGNPFFINQLLDHLYGKKYIWLNAADNTWKWNIAGIRELAVNENIATVIIDKIKNNSPQNLEVLTYASCLGNDFSLASLHFITQIPEPDLHNQLWEAIRENIIEPVDSDYKFVPGFYEKNKTRIKFRFTHDRIQQALYSLTEPAQREELHFKAAEFIITNPAEIENVFITANHLASCGNLLQNSKHRKESAEILLEAGQWAFSSGAYESSYVFLSLFEKIAEQEGEINISNYSLLIQSAYLNKKEDKVREYTDKAFGMAKGKIERSGIYEAVLKGSIAMNQLNEAIATARKAFQELGFTIPRKQAGKFQVVWAAIKTQITFPSKKIKEITRFPKMTDEVGIALMQLIYNALEAFFFVERNTYPLLIFKMINLSNKLGNTPESIIGYGSYGLILAGVMHKPEAGYSAGKEAMKLFETFDAPQLVSAAGFVDTTMISHWKESLVSFEKECLTYYEKGLNTGNLEYAAWNLYTHSNSVFFRGGKISEIVEMFESYEKFYVRHRQLNAYGASLVIKNTLNKLLDPGYVSLLDDQEEQQLFNVESKANNTVFLFVYNFMKIFTGAWHNQYADVLKNVLQNQKDIENTASLYWQPYFRALKTVIYINCAFENALDYKKIKKEIKSDRKKIAAANTLFEGNVGWILDLMDAEMESFEKRVVNHQLYSQASDKAKKYGFHFPALLIELMRIQKMKYLKLNGAYDYFSAIKANLSYFEMHSVIYAWETKYPELKEQKKSNNRGAQNSDTFTADQFDARTIIKTTEILSGEIVLDKLIDKMMQFAMENAGARYGCFMIKKDNRYELVSQKFADEQEKNKGRPNGIPVSIFNYVNHTGEPLILDAASDTAPYNNDPDVLAAAEKSVMCVPIIHQNASIGMLYLANQLSKSVFTEERVGLLKMLAGQMGVSLQNAILYENMEKLVEKRTEQLAQQMLKTDSLLLNILPQEVATELKEHGKATPRYYRDATVLFCDIVNFTRRAEKLTAEELIEELDLCFKAFDGIIARHGIEKIKTIGDAYLCVGGIPTESSDHALNAVRASIEIQQWMQDTFTERAKTNKDFFKLRIGIHSGPVVAGVVGSSKFAYDIWGDTVNTASRLEQNGEGGKINISESVYAAVHTQIPCIYRGEIEAKNKGMLKMYFVA